MDCDWMDEAQEMNMEPDQTYPDEMIVESSDQMLIDTDMEQTASSKEFYLPLPWLFYTHEVDSRRRPLD